MTNFLDMLKNEAQLAFTENGALTNSTSQSDCLDLFFRMGGMRFADEEAIEETVLRAYAEDPVKTMKILFYGRDIRGGLGERRFFRTAIGALANRAPEAVMRNVHLFSEYGRFDDLLSLLGTPCEDAAIAVIRARLETDLTDMEQGKQISLMAKWLPSVNASSAETCATGRYIAKMLGMRPADYRKMLSKLRRYTGIIENCLRESDYTFDYETQTSGAMFKYRKAFLRNDGERYEAYLEQVHSGKATMHADTLYPYQIVRAVLDQTTRSYFHDNTIQMERTERRALDAAWKNLPAYGCTKENTIAVVDGSGSMYTGDALRPVDAAMSLGIYFAEHNNGLFAGHFITFSSRPQLVKVKGADIAEKVVNCMKYNDISNTNLEAVFMLILQTALKNRAGQSEMPEKLVIISDMEFDRCIIGGNDQTLFAKMRKLYTYYGYRLPEIVFWDVASRQQNIPVTFSETGAALVSGASPSVFDMITGGTISPEIIMNRIIESPRYALVS